MWIRVPPKKRVNSTLSALADFKRAFREAIKTRGVVNAVRTLPEIYSHTADDAVVRRTLEDEKRNYSHANKVWRQIENSSPLSLRRFTRQEIWEAVFMGHCQNAASVPVLPQKPGRDLRDIRRDQIVQFALDRFHHTSSRANLFPASAAAPERSSILAMTHEDASISLGA